MKTTLALILAITLGAVAADAGKKTGRRISGGYRDKGFREKVETPKATPSPAHPYYPYRAFNMPWHHKQAGLAFTMPTHPPLAFTVPTHPPQA